MHAAWQAKGGHEDVQLRMPRRVQAQPRDRAAVLPHKFDQRRVSAPDALPADGGLKVDGLRDRQPRAPVACPLELQEPQPRRRTEFVALVLAAKVMLPAPADLQW